MKKHIVASDYDYTKSTKEWNDLPSETLPDQTMSIAEIMQRYAVGLPIDGAKVPFYEIDENKPETLDNAVDYARMDRVDAAMYAKDMAEETKQRRKELQEDKQKLDEAKKNEIKQKNEEIKKKKEDSETKEEPKKPDESK